MDGYRVGRIPEAFLVHPGGPYWGRKDAGAWSIPKGELEEGDEPWGHWPDHWPPTWHSRILSCSRDGSRSGGRREPTPSAMITLNFRHSGIIRVSASKVVSLLPAQRQTPYARL